MIEEYGFTIEFNSSAYVRNQSENFLTRIEGKILYEDDDGESLLAGKLGAYYADLQGAIAHREHPYDVLDLRGETELFYSALYDSKTNEFKESVLKLFEYEVFNINLLILDRLEILPEYRGKGLGLACLYRCMQQYQHGCGLVVLKPFPLQFETIRESGEKDDRDEREDQESWRQSLILKEFGTDQKACTRKLEKYYQRLGFIKIPRTEVMALNPPYSLSPFQGLR